MRPLAVLAATLLLAAWPAQAFASVQDGKSPHDEITAVAADAGWPEGAVEALQAAVRQPDIDDLQPAPVEGNEKRMDVSPTFRPWHHCGRVAPATDAEAVDATVAYVAHERALARNLSLLDPPAAVRALGRALHALQDCFSHSDAVDLGLDEQRALADALVKGGKAPPGLRICGIQPGAPDIERPAGDAYAHAAFNKDDEEASPEARAVMADGRSKFEHARGLARDATRAFLTDFMAGLGPVESERLLGVDLAKQDEAKTFGVPSPGIIGPLAALALAASLRRPPRTHR